MNVELFCVLDMAAERYIDPFPAPTVAFALRGFEEACRTEGHQFSKFPEDYALYHIGVFDPEKGVIEGVVPRKIGVATSFSNTVNLIKEIDDERHGTS